MIFLTEMHDIQKAFTLILFHVELCENEKKEKKNDRKKGEKNGIMSKILLSNHT